jgi:hypothetical protein
VTRGYLAITASTAHVGRFARKEDLHCPAGGHVAEMALDSRLLREAL